MTPLLLFTALDEMQIWYFSLLRPHLDVFLLHWCKLFSGFWSLHATVCGTVFFSLPQLVFILSPCSCKYFEQCFTFCHSLSVWWWMMMMMDFFVFMSCTSSTQPLLVYKTPKMQLQWLSNSLHYISLENDKLFCSINFNKVFCPLSCAWHRKSAPKEALSSKSQLKFFS